MSPRTSSAATRRRLLNGMMQSLVRDVECRSRESEENGTGRDFDFEIELFASEDVEQGCSRSRVASSGWAKDTG